MSLDLVDIDAIEKPEKIKKIWDKDGLYIRALPSGKKLWHYRYRFNNTDTCISLGRYPEVSLNEARKKRFYIASLVLDGVNPIKDRRVNRIKEAEEARKNQFRNEICRILDSFVEKHDELNPRDCVISILEDYINQG